MILDPGALAGQLRVPNSLPFLFYFIFLNSWHQKTILANAASGNVCLVVAVTTNCMSALGTGCLTLILQTEELLKKKKS